MLMGSFLHHQTETWNGQKENCLTTDLNNAKSQLKFYKDTAKHCNFNTICG